MAVLSSLHADPSTQARTPQHSWWLNHYTTEIISSGKCSERQQENGQIKPSLGLEVKKKPSLTFLSQSIHWTMAKLWDTARDYGIQGSRSLLRVSWQSLLSSPVQPSKITCAHTATHHNKRPALRRACSV